MAPAGKCRRRFFFAHCLSMKPDAIVPAEVDFSDATSPRSPRFGDVYHPEHGAWAQAEHVFLAGNGLPARWHGRDAFTILETGFGLGNNFLATWAAWRADARRCARLRFVSVEKHPLRRDDLRRALAGSPAPELAQALCAAWPPLTPDFHRLAFDDGRVELLLLLGDAAQRLRELVATVDAFYLDGFAPAKNPQMWEPGLFKSLSRLAAPGATAATWSSARAVRDGLQQAGFAWRRADGIGGKRDITLAGFAPRVAPRRPAARTRTAGVRQVAIVGGGLAGAACARALAREGLHCTVIDRHAAPAAEASGNAGGLFHGVFHPDDGMHARAHRAAALVAAQAHAEAIAAGVPGRCDGLLRLVPEHADAAPLAEQLARAGLPPEYVQAWSPAQVEAAGGPACAAWFYPGGGWISPAALVRHWLGSGDPAVRWIGGRAVARIECAASPGGGDAPWRLLDAAGDLVAQAQAVVFANAGAALSSWSLVTDAAGGAGPAAAEWTGGLALTRGQVSIVAADTPGLRAPLLPLAGAGYALTLPDGAVVCGATSTAGDADSGLRAADHVHNLAQLAALTDSALAPAGRAVDEAFVRELEAAGRLHGRVGWRAGAPDRLPIVGAVPMQPAAGAALPDQPRHWPRVPGLFACSGFGSRGLTWAPLAGRLIAAWIADAPYPLPADLVDALDPARFATRRVRASRRPG
jgi:tRNA 5-methylaminomethyl-2-thiouridine biosynthesis bifunctional protein